MDGAPCFIATGEHRIFDMLEPFAHPVRVSKATNVRGIFMATRNVGYYWVHYSNLDTVNFGIQSGVGLGYWAGKKWQIWLSDRSEQLSHPDDSHIDHVYPQLPTPPPFVPGRPPGYRWVKPPDEDWQIAWSDGDGRWECLREKLIQEGDWPEQVLEAFGSWVSPPS